MVVAFHYRINVEEGVAIHARPQPVRYMKGWGICIYTVHTGVTLVYIHKHAHNVYTRNSHTGKA